MRLVAAALLLALAGTQLARCADAGSAAYDEVELVREVEAAAAVAGATAEPAIPIAPAAPTFTPLVPTKADVICMDGAAPAIKLNKANCVARYTPVYKAVSLLNDQATQLSNELEAAQQTIDEKTSRISDLYAQIEDLEKQLAAQAKRWTSWLEGNVTQAELAGEKKVNATQAAHDKTAAQLKFCKADLADAQEAKASTVAKLGEVQAQLDQQQQDCSKSGVETAADLSTANRTIVELKRSLAECVEEADAIAAVAEEWAAEIKQAQQAMQAGDCSEAVALIQASVNDTQIALDECNANLIRLQASSITGEDYPVHVRPAAAPAPAPEEPAVARKEAAHGHAEPAVKAADEAAPAPKPAVAHKKEEEQAAPALAPEAAVARKPAAGKPAVAPKQVAAPAPAPEPAVIRKPAAAAKQEAAPAPAPEPALVRKPAVAAKQEAVPAPAPQPALVRKPAAAAKQEAAPAPAPEPALVRKPAVAAKPEQEAAPAPAPAAAEPFQITEARGNKKAGGRKAGKQEKSNKKQKKD